jgi:hypothetical protein
MLIQIVLTVIAAATASAMFAAGVRRPRWTKDYRPILAALAEEDHDIDRTPDGAYRYRDDLDVLPPDGRWEPVNRWESVLVPCGPEDDGDEWVDLGGEG